MLTVTLIFLLPEAILAKAQIARLTSSSAPTRPSPSQMNNPRVMAAFQQPPIVWDDPSRMACGQGAHCFTYRMKSSGACACGYQPPSKRERGTVWKEGRSWCYACWLDADVSCTGLLCGHAKAAMARIPGRIPFVPPSLARAAAPPDTALMDVDSNHRGSAAGSDSIFQNMDPWNYPPSPRFVFRENWQRVEQQLGARLDKVESMYSMFQQWQRQLEELATQVQRAMADMEQQRRQLEELALEQQKAAEKALSSSSSTDDASFTMVKTEKDTTDLEELKTTLKELVSRMQALETKKDTVT